MREYNKFINLSRIKLPESDLVELVALIREGFEEEDPLYIKTIIGNTSIEENSAELFLQQSLPNILDNIEIRTFQYTSGSRKKSVNLTLGYSSHLLVGSLDQAWALGKEAQLLNYLKSKNPYFSFLTPPIKSVIMGGIIVLYIPPFLFFLKLLFTNKVTGLEVTLAFLAELILIIFQRILINLRPTTITIKDTDSDLKKYSWAISLIIELLALIAVVVFGIIQFKSRG